MQVPTPSLAQRAHVIGVHKIYPSIVSVSTVMALNECYSITSSSLAYTLSESILLSFVLIVAVDGRALLVNFKRGTVLHHFNFKKPVRALSFSPDGRSVMNTRIKVLYSSHPSAS